MTDGQEGGVMNLAKFTQYMIFRLVEQKPKTAVWNVLSRSNGGLLGIIKWHSPWRQYCFFPEPDCVFNNSCMMTIINFIKEVKGAT